MQRAILRSWSYNKHPTSLRGCPLWQHFVYFFENVSLHVLSIHWATDNPTTEFMMCLRLRSLNQAWTLLGNPSPIPLPRRRLWLWTFCLALPVESCNSAAYGLGPESVPHSPSSPPVLPSAKFLPKFEVLGLYFSSPGFRCSVRVHRPTGKGLHLDSSLLGNRSSLCPFSKPTRRSVAQLAWCWVQANKSPWLAAFIRSDSAQLTWPSALLASLCGFQLPSTLSRTILNMPCGPSRCQHPNPAGTCCGRLCPTLKPQQIPGNKLLCQWRNSFNGFMSSIPSSPLPQFPSKGQPVLWRHIHAHTCPLAFPRQTLHWLLCLLSSPKAAIYGLLCRPAAGFH